MSRCRSCNAEIIWTVTDAGKKMPVDREPTGKGIALIPLARDEIRSRVVDVHESHFVTCPNADQHRKAS